jgi:hypothetical protein
MSPRAGGEAAKFCERYEGRWTVAQLLRVLAGQATSLLVEDEAALAQGAEFTLRRMDGGAIAKAEAMRGKRGTAGSARPRSAYARAGPGEAWPRGSSSSRATVSLAWTEMPVCRQERAHCSPAMSRARWRSACGRDLNRIQGLFAGLVISSSATSS